MHNTDAVNALLGFLAIAILLVTMLIGYSECFTGESHRAAIFNQLNCAWCYAKNEAIEGEAVYCRECSHRADVERDKCNCWLCSTRRELMSVRQVTA